jgi:hypothetical protein
VAQERLRRWPPRRKGLSSPELRRAGVAGLVVDRMLPRSPGLTAAAADAAGLVVDRMLPRSAPGLIVAAADAAAAAAAAAVVFPMPVSRRSMPEGPSMTSTLPV